MPEQPSQPQQPPNSEPASAAQPASSASLLKKGLAWGLGLGLLAWLLHRTPIDQVQAALTRPDWQTWALTLSGLLTSYLLRAARLQVVLNLEGHTKAPRKWLGLRTDALRVILMHNAAINLLPMRAGELSFPWLASRELGMPVARAIACLMWMRVQDVIVLVALGLALWPGLPAWWRVAGLAALVLGWKAATWLMQRWLSRHAQTPGQEGRLSALLRRLQHALLEPEHHHPLAWLATLANWSLKLAAGACLLSAVSAAPWASPGQVLWVENWQPSCHCKALLVSALMRLGFGRAWQRICQPRRPLCLRPSVPHWPCMFVFCCAPSWRVHWPLF